MSDLFRKFLAATEAAGGMVVVALPAMLSAQGFSLAWWYWLLLESFGGMAVAAGFWLWRNEPRGWRFSRILQALQIVQVQTATWGIAMVAGFQLRVLVSETSFSVGPAFYGTFAIMGGDDAPWWVSVNFFSAYALYALLRSGPGDGRPADWEADPEPAADLVDARGPRPWSAGVPARSAPPPDGPPDGPESGQP